MLLIDFPDQQPTGFIRCTGWNFHHSGVRPQSLCILKINAVLALVLGAFIGVDSNTMALHGQLRSII
jgi:hypothetical protein